MDALGPTVNWFMTQGVLGVMLLLSLAGNVFLLRFVLRQLEKRAEEAEARTTVAQTSLNEATTSRISLTNALTAQSDSLGKVLENIRIQQRVEELTRERAGE
jgi:Kef-type K+ transport system membrane component KefB